MHKLRIQLVTSKDAAEFVNLANEIEDNVYLVDGTGYTADAKSLMGVMYGKFEFKELWVISDSDKVSTKILKFIYK